MASNGQYYNLWENNRTRIIKSVIYGGGTIALSKSDFILDGNRDSYTFRIEYVNGKAVRRGGSAVARDLQDILEQYSAFDKVMHGKDVVIRMGNSFVLEILVSGDAESECEVASIGTTILHTKLGHGTIESIDGDFVCVKFGSKSVKLDYRFALGIGTIELKK